MKYKDYSKKVNKFWKHDDGLRELIHCRLAIIEEIGEIAGWYKKHIGYRRPKDKTWRLELKGEIGDLMYYLVKISEITGDSEELKDYFDIPLKEVTDMDPTNVCANLAKSAVDVVTFSPHSIEFIEALHIIMVQLLTLLSFEGYELTDVLHSNIAKLEARHGEAFNDAAATEKGRNRDKERGALDG